MLEHLAANLFQERPQIAAEAGGLSLIEASGDIGEARLVARQLHNWIAAGVDPASIVITARDLMAKEALLREVLDEYAVPAVWAIPEMIAKCGAIALLRKIWPLAANGFRFRDVAAIWRNAYFRPAFESDLPLRAEALLRQLDVPRDKAAILNAVLESAEDRRPQPLEDESMERRQRRKHRETAQLCLGFYQWFFKLWDAIPEAATPARLAKEVRRLAKELGINKLPLPGADDAAALTAFGNALDEWAIGNYETTITRDDFERVLTNITATTPWMKSLPDTGVRVLAVVDAANVTPSHMIVLGLGEGSFPQLNDVTGDEFDAQLALEKLLFARLVAAPRQALVLSYPALDDRGQALLPSSFVLDVKGLFEKIPATTQTMLIDGYLTWPPISAAEVRAQFADEKPNIACPAGVSANLANAKKMAAARFRNSDATQYSGILADETIIAAIAKQFGPECVFSPTSLETYVACPFRFWMEIVLGLERLEEPNEEVEVSRRGSAIHLALSRFHQKRPHERPEEIANELASVWSLAVRERAERSPSPAAKALWHLERRRVQRALNRYPTHWESFRGGWSEKNIEPMPEGFEAMFGYGTDPALTIEVDGVQVRIGGIIDRIDLAKLDNGLGFWIIDYKTGSGTAYRAKDLENFERLQLPLYALAVERVIHAAGKVRPLGLAYWLIVKDGPKAMLPDGRREYAWAADAEAWPKYREELERVVARVATSLRHGDFRLAPRHKETCEYCDFCTVCRINQQRGRLAPLPLIDDDE